ncbi:TonB-dependent siderophore receptor [Aureimonas leprariae]|uniref:TonB-dependent siderophore receptor n=1 Tax=Plantimonas leprariae TaxID=2615207 RepID=A0A7V7PLZ8_9HYPH|nr:TonB-dependent siderophore receptor [Aureimonas leprariae]KAB0677703.1 TonB-dependent siderophore receptor [Aureimonas leprariae]
MAASPFFPPRRSVFLCCVLGLVPASAGAQDVIDLDTVNVRTDGPATAAAAAANGRQDTNAAARSGATEGNGTGPVNGYVAKVTTTGSKTSTPIIEIPQTISVVTQDQLEDRAVQNLGEALSYTPGIVTQPFGNDPRFFAPIIRGFNSTYSIYLNNFRFSRDFGAIAFEPYGQERIEVIKGPASVLYGQDEPGGIVNLVQKRPTGTQFGEVGGEIGTDDRYVAKFDLGGVLSDVVSYRLTGLGRLADEQQDFTDDKRFYIAPTLTISPDADTSLTILSSVQYDAGTSPLGLPQLGTLDDNPLGEIPRSRYVGDPDFNGNDSTLGTVGYEFRHRFNDTFEFRQNVQYVSYDSDYNNFFFLGLLADNRTATRLYNVQSEKYDGLGIDNQFESKFETGPLEHTTLIGLDYRNNEQWRSSNFSGSLTTIDVFDPVYGGFDYDPGPASVTDTRLQQLGVYAQDQIKLGGLVTTLSLRQDFAENENERTSDSRNYDKLTGRVGALYLFDSGIAPYVSYSTSFNPTAGANDSQELLKPTEGEQVEGGVKYQPPGSNALVTASVFEVTKTNIVNTEFTAAGPVITQVGEARSRGFELEANASLVEGLDLVAAYTYTDTEVRDSIRPELIGRNLINVPNNAASLWLNYTVQPNALGPNLAWLEGVSLGGGVRYLGDRYANDINTIELSDTTVFDAALRYEKNNFKAALNVSNLTDKRYVSSCSFGCFFGDGRKVIGSLSYKW